MIGHIIKKLNSESVHKIKLKNSNWELLQENDTPNLNIRFKKVFFNVLRAFNTVI